jgi:hypothetical protein
VFFGFFANIRLGKVKVYFVVQFDKLKNELSPRPGVVKESQSDLINLIQNGGTFSPKEDLTKVSSLINKTTQDALRTRFNQYLERNLG